MIKFTYFHQLSSEGAGSLLQREIFAYFAAEIMGYEFVGISNEFMLGHEPNHITKEKLNRDWGSLRNCIGNYIDKNQINIQNIVSISSISCLSKAINYYSSLDEVFYLNINYDISHKIFKNQSDIIKAKLVNNFRTKIFNKLNLDSKNYVALHIRCCSKADEVFGVDTLPWQHFNKDYGLHNNNQEFYHRLYRGVLFKIVKNFPKDIRPKLNIYSTCNSNELDIFCDSLKDNFDVKLVLNGYSFDDFIALSSAKILISAHSSFSWMASFINPNCSYIRSGFRHELPYNTVAFFDKDAVDYNYRDVFLTYITRIFYIIQKLYFKLKDKS